MKILSVFLVIFVFFSRVNGESPQAESSVIHVASKDGNAMDTVPQQFAEVVTNFLLDTKSKAD